MNLHFMLRPVPHRIPVHLFACSCYNVGPCTPTNKSALPKEKNAGFESMTGDIFLHLSTQVSLVIIK